MNQISDRQFFFIIFVSITSLTFFSVPTLLIPKVKQDLWLSMALGTVIDIYVAYILFWLGRKYSGQSLVEYSSTVLGKIGKLFGLMYVLFFIGVIILSVWIFSNFLTTTLEPETPSFVFVLTITIAAGWAAYNGLETIGRLSEMIAILILLAAAFMFLFSIPEVNLKYLLPQFENGLWPAVKSSVYPGSWFGICIMMGMLMPHHNNPKNTFKVKASAVLLGSAIMTLLLLYTVAIIGPEMATRLYYPIYEFSRIIHPNFLERIDVLLMLIYISGAFISISILYYVASEGAAQLFHIGTHRQWIVPFGILVVVIPGLPFENIALAYKFFNNLFPAYALVIEGGLTSFIFITAFIVDRRNGEGDLKNKGNSS